MTTDVLTPEQLAERFQITTAKCEELRVRQGWPHLRLGRFAVRYTPAQVAEIEQQMSAGEKRTAPAPVPLLSGQTARSAVRSRR